MAKDVSKINDVGSVYAEIMSNVNKLAGLTNRFRTERFTFDIQISIGKSIFFKQDNKIELKVGTW
jgi:hypothetical protein